MLQEAPTKYTEQQRLQGIRNRDNKVLDFITPKNFLIPFRNFCHYGVRIFYFLSNISRPPIVVIRLFLSNEDRAAMPTTWGLRMNNHFLMGVVDNSPKWIPGGIRYAHRPLDGGVLECCLIVELRGVEP